MRFLSHYAGLLFVIATLASCQDSMQTCSTDLSGVLTEQGDGSGCQSMQCEGAQLDCNQNASDGCETNVLGDVNNCGSCGYKCATPAVGEAICENGVCGVTTCSARYKDCNGNAADSCETDTNRDAMNCGGCGNVCGAGANAVGVCVQGKCQLSCQGLYLDCDGDAANGCEVNGASDLANCGNCGNVCSKIGATTPACSAGSCGSTVCTGSYRTCKAGPVNGCETDTATSVGNCGTCGKACPAVANGVAGCAASNCGIASCNANFDNCDGAVANGCEINTSTNIAHCGGCGKACPTYANASAQCKASACSLGTCNAGFANCDMNDANGCEINTNTDKNNCGQCGKVCAATESCYNGTCLAGCPGNPQWMPVNCTTTQWVWSSDRANATTVAAANTKRVLYTGCSHGSVANTCSLTGTGWVSTAVYTMSGCNTNWYHLGGSYTGNCGGHDGDQVRRLALNPTDCYPY